MSSYNFDIECPFCESGNVELECNDDKLVCRCIDCGEIGSLEDFWYIFEKNHEND